MYIVLDKRAPGFSTLVNGKAVARESDALDGIAEQLGVKPLNEFVSMSAEDARDLLGDGDFDVPPVEEWFSADEGVVVVDALIRHVQANRQSVSDADAVLQDLSEFAAVLSKTKEIGARWHMAYDV